MKTLLAVALLTSPIAMSPAYAANEPRTDSEEVRIKKANLKPEQKADQKAEQETVYTTIYESAARPAPKSSVDFSIRIKNSWADIYLRFNLG